MIHEIHHISGCFEIDVGWKRDIGGLNLEWKMVEDGGFVRREKGQEGRLLTRRTRDF